MAPTEKGGEGMVEGGGGGGEGLVVGVGVSVVECASGQPPPVNQDHPENKTCMDMVVFGTHHAHSLCMSCFDMSFSMI